MAEIACQRPQFGIMRRGKGWVVGECSVPQRSKSGDKPPHALHQYSLESKRALVGRGLLPLWSAALLIFISVCSGMVGRFHMAVCVCDVECSRYGF